MQSRTSQGSGDQHRERKRSKRCSTGPTDPGSSSAEVHQDTTMADEPNWNANEETDTKDVEALVEEPEFRDDYVRVDVYVPILFTRPRKLERCKNDLRRSFNVNAVIERPQDRDIYNLIRVEGYGFEPDSILSCIRRYDSSASIVP